MGNMGGGGSRYHVIVLGVTRLWQVLQGDSRRCMGMAGIVWCVKALEGWVAVPMHGRHE
jgi:hypothetical protein